MRFKNETIQELISIFQKEFGKTISEEEAQMIGLRIVQFIYAKDFLSVERRKNNVY
jgi:hypothetical protein